MNQQANSTRFVARPVLSESDFRTYNQIANDADPAKARTFDDLMANHHNLPEGTYRERFLLDVEGVPTLAFVIMRNIWQKDETNFFLDFAKVGDYAKEEAEFVVSFAMPIAKENGAKKLNTWNLETATQLNAVLEENGFVFDQLNPESRLDLTKFDGAPFQDKVDYVKSQPWRLISLADLEREDPENYIARYHEGDRELSVDVPTPWELQAPPLENYAKALERDRQSFDTILIVLDGEKIVATTMLFRNKVNPETFETGLTGVHRDYRRHGIATAIKVINLTRAKELGGKFAYCDNEENNPMLQLNYQLGFETYRRWASTTKVLD